MMKLSKNAVRFLIFIGLALLVFNVIAFVVPFAKTGTFWIGYLFGMISILGQIAVMKLAFNGTTTVRSKFYGFPVARIGIIYAVVQVLLSIFVMALAAYIPAWIPVVIFIILFAIDAAGLVASDTVREEVVHQDAKIVEDVKAMRNLQSKMNMLVSQSDCNEEVKSALSSLAEEIKYSDPVSGKATKELEQELLFDIEELQKVVVDGDNESALKICKKTMGILAERNRLCKLNKNNK